MAVQTCADAAGSLREVHFVLFGEAAYEAFGGAAQACAGERPADDGAAAVSKGCSG